ncbi:Replication protein A 14 kDa subunit [Camelus dromedarius]|uniref:Replication protein A 14 kDa subunit n=1 Tax=Camelus dromedarius TaxID=9838 RepID=A0A5N4DRB1_CAMDR|nr:Replication protein A 14 kDa subunit [Camelus dromedarius]
MKLLKPRINANMLPICFVGRLEKTDPTRRNEGMEKGENGTTELMEPLDEEISGIAELIRRVEVKGT